MTLSETLLWIFLLVQLLFLVFFSKTIVDFLNRLRLIQLKMENKNSEDDV
jgi:hypothetical protein